MNTVRVCVLNLLIIYASQCSETLSWLCVCVCVYTHFFFMFKDNRAERWREATWNTAHLSVTQECFDLPKSGRICHLSDFSFQPNYSRHPHEWEWLYSYDPHNVQSKNQRPYNRTGLLSAPFLGYSFCAFIYIDGRYFH